MQNSSLSMDYYLDVGCFGLIFSRGQWAVESIRGRSFQRTKFRSSWREGTSEVRRCQRPFERGPLCKPHGPKIVEKSLAGQTSWSFKTEIRNRRYQTHTVGSPPLLLEVSWR